MTMRQIAGTRLSRLGLASVALAITAVGMVSSTQAAVLVNGFVTPSDDLRTQFIDEGIVDYEFDPGIAVNMLADQPDFAHPENIIVGDGQTPGQLVINGGTALRYQHLILGGTEEDIDDDNGTTGDPVLGFGDGLVRIEGFGTLFNNAPEILPSAVSGTTTTDGTPITSEGQFDSTPRPDNGGFDVYVGLTGSGTLAVSNGGRMEIQDGLLIGLAAGKISRVSVEGLGSRIDQRGAGGGGDGDPSPDDDGTPLLVGPSGVAFLDVLDGGQIDARAGMAIGAVDIDGGLVSTNPDIGLPTFGGNGNGGQGFVTVDGFAAAIRVAGGIAVGTYADDPEDYEEPYGTGELMISNGGAVSAYRQEEDGAPDEEAAMVIGNFGRVTLDDGMLFLADDLTSDGRIAGDGRIQVRNFKNRTLGQVTVAQDQHLIFRSNAEDADEASDDTGSFFMANDGLIDIDGGTIEFKRTFESADDHFKNRFAEATDDLAEVRGVIRGQNATMRFHSGLSNESVLAFTSGVNTVDGDVINQVTGSVVLTGGSNTTFEDDLMNLGTLELAPTASNVELTVLGDFVSAASASLSFNLGGGPTSAEVSHMTVAGDAALSGALSVDLTGSASPATGPMPGDEFELISGAGLLTGAFSSLSLPLLSDPAWSWLIDTTDSDFTLVVTDIIPIGADFNGDGIVNEQDLEVWRTNYGIAMGATGVLGDADGDGDVDGDDYFAWLDQVGGAGVPAAIVSPGFNGGPVSVPEPTSMVLLAGVLVLGGWLRRQP